jgi:hypothetical protein
MLLCLLVEKEEGNVMCGLDRDSLRGRSYAAGSKVCKPMP